MGGAEAMDLHKAMGSGPAEDGKWVGLRLWIHIRQWARSCIGGEVGGAEAMDVQKAMGSYRTH